MITRKFIVLTLLAFTPVCLVAEPILEKQSVPTIPIQRAIAEQSSTLGSVWFESGSAIAAPWSMQTLETVGRKLSTGDGKALNVLVEGHADSLGNQYENQVLSERRALQVKRYLVSVHNIDKARIHAIGLGEAMLAATPKSKLAESRKVVISVLERAEKSAIIQN